MAFFFLFMVQLISGFFTILCIEHLRNPASSVLKRFVDRCKVIVKQLLDGASTYNPVMSRESQKELITFAAEKNNRYGAMGLALLNKEADIYGVFSVCDSRLISRANLRYLQRLCLIIKNSVTETPLHLTVMESSSHYSFCIVPRQTVKPGENLYEYSDLFGELTSEYIKELEASIDMLQVIRNQDKLTLALYNISRSWLPKEFVEDWELNMREKYLDWVYCSNLQQANLELSKSLRASASGLWLSAISGRLLLHTPHTVSAISAIIKRFMS